MCSRRELAEFYASIATGGESKDDVRLHELRHSFAAVGASGGNSLLVIGALLGHAEHKTTQRYAHLYDETLRHAANHVGRVIAEPTDE